jgi:acetyl/propionyl-CoA carboxylase alpha subunit
MKYIATIGDQEYLVEILDEHHVLVDGRSIEVDFSEISDQPVYSLLLDGNSYEAYVYPTDKTWQVLLHGRLYPAMVEDERERRLRAAAGSQVQESGEYYLKAPMPGLVVAISVVEGQPVKKGDVLIVLESMKMQNELKSPRDGVAARLRVKAGDSVVQHQTILSVT